MCNQTDSNCVQDVTEKEKVDRIDENIDVVSNPASADVAVSISDVANDPCICL